MSNEREQLILDLTNILRGGYVYYKGYVIDETLGSLVVYPSANVSQQSPMYHAKPVADAVNYVERGNK